MGEQEPVLDMDLFGECFLAGARICGGFGGGILEVAYRSVVERLDRKVHLDDFLSKPASSVP